MTDGQPSLTSYGQGSLRQKLEKAMINEYGCAMKPKAYIRSGQASVKSIKLLAIQHKESYFYQFQVGFLLGLSGILLTSTTTFLRYKTLAKQVNIACKKLLFVSVSLAMDNQGTLLLREE